MPKIRNTSGENLTVPSLGGRLVLDGGVVEVSAAEVYGFTQQSIWEPVDDAATKAHDHGEADYFERLRADGQAVPGDAADPAPEVEDKPAPVKKSSKSNETPEV